MRFLAQAVRPGMGLANAIRPRLFAALTLAAFVALLGLLLLEPDWRLGDSFLRNSYDLLHTVSGVQSDATSNSPVVIVYLDLGSFREKDLDPAHPWPRELHAQLLRRLTAAGARAVVFDIVFSQAGPTAEADQSFANAIRDNGRVILAAEYYNTTFEPNDQRVWGRLGTVVPPHNRFTNAAAAWGIAAQRPDDDDVVRRYLAGFTRDPQPTIAWATATWLHLPLTRDAESKQAANEHWIRYYGPPFKIPHVSYSRALDPAGVSDDFFLDKIVFVGARPFVESLNERKDEFRNPFHTWQYRAFVMPGVEVHATELLNVIRGDWLRRFDVSTEQALLLVCGLVFGIGLMSLRPIPATVAALAVAGLTLGLARSEFAHGTWFPWLIVAAAQIPTALGGSVLFHSVEWYRARRRLEAAQRVADAKIREQAALIDKAHDAILVQDLDGRMLYANPSAERLYGWKLSALQHAEAVTELFSPDSATATAARNAVLAQGEWNGELRQQTRTGEIVTVASRWTLIRDDAARPQALLLINSDITEQKQLEVQFLRTQRMNTIGTLAGGMAHDLNNALAPILMGVQLLRRKTNDDDESRRMLALIEANTHRSADMVRQVLLFARGRGGEFERLELGPLVKELERLVRETFPKNISVETYLPRDLWPVRGNPTQLHQVLLNLCVNARDAMPSGGRLSFASDNVELGAAEAAAIPNATPGQYVSLLVSDAGTGMPPEVRARIFEPFFTTKGEGLGTGIGLATVLRIVKSHAGFLRVESEPGQGTTFEIFLPRATEAILTATAARPIELPRGNGELVLVVDDEQAVRDLVAESLSTQGYRVLTAANGAEAVALFRQHASKVRLLITDSGMPVLGGAGTISALRQQQPDLPVILASGEAGAEDSHRANVALLRKPFSLEELLIAVGQCLRAH